MTGVPSTPNGGRLHSLSKGCVLKSPFLKYLGYPVANVLQRERFLYIFKRCPLCIPTKREVTTQTSPWQLRNFLRQAHVVHPPPSLAPSVLHGLAHREPFSVPRHTRNVETDHQHYCQALDCLQPVIFALLLRPLRVNGLISRAMLEIDLPCADQVGGSGGWRPRAASPEVACKSMNGGMRCAKGCDGGVLENLCLCIVRASRLR